MGGVFISYRREDSIAYAGRLFDRLSQRFGREQLFMDLDTLEAGVDFVEVIEKAVASCDVLIALIGKQWLTVTDEHGRRRLDNEEDFVRLEIQTALERNIRVIPALVGGTTMPRKEVLPGSLIKLARRHAHEIGDKRFHTDVNDLIKVLEKIVVETQDKKPGSSEPIRPPAHKPEGMVLVPKGPFLYGDERVQRTIPHDFWIDIFPVTNETYKAFIQANGYANPAYWSDEGWRWKTANKISGPEYWNDPKWNKPGHPVVGVSFYEAEAYSRWAGKRLPTEQEWEKAARGTDGREYPWGDEFDKNKCNSAASGIKSTSPVSKYPNGVSPYGCYDMAGNVWERTSSRRDERPEERVLRGGSWDFAPIPTHSASRDWYTQPNRAADIGFRCAQDI